VLIGLTTIVIWQLLPEKALAAELNFDPTPVMTVSSPQTIFMAADLRGATLDPAPHTVHGTDFFVSGSTCSASGCDVSVVFRPTIRGYAQDTVTFSYVAGGIDHIAGPTVLVSGIGGPDGPVVSFSAREVWFPEQVINRGFGPGQQFSMSNTGATDLYFATEVMATDMLGLQLLGPPPDFATGSTCTSPLKPNDTCLFNAIFDPGPLSGVHHAWLVVHSNAASDPQRVLLTGFGVLFRAGNVSLQSIDFGQVQTGSVSAPRQILYTNTTPTPQFLSAASSSDAPFVHTSNDCPSPLNSGQSCTFTATFAPTSSGAIGGFLYLNANEFGSTVIALSGLATDFAPRPLVSVDQTVVNFGDVPVGATGFQHVTLTNVGEVPMWVDSASISITEVTSSHFDSDSLRQALGRSVGTCATAIAPGSSCDVVLSFAPATEGQVVGQLSMSVSSGGDNSGFLVPAISLRALSSYGSPLVTLSTTSLDFGQRTVGDPATLTSGTGEVQLTNSGRATLHMRASIADGNFTLAPLSTCGLSLAIGASCNFVIDFSPVQSGRIDAQLRIDDNATGTPHIVQLIGHGTVGPLVRLDTSSVDFGHVRANDVGADRTITMSNTGSLDLTYTASIADAAYTLSGGTCGLSSATLLPGSVCTFVMHFQPTDGIEHIASLVLDDNATDTPQRVRLDGFGELPFTGCLSLATRPHLTLLNSPYTITCGLQVDSGKSATFDAGVELRMTDDAEFHVLGTLNVDGTDEGAGHVLITSRTRDSGSVWNGITFHDGAQAKIAHLTVENIRGGQALAFGSVAQATLDHVTVQHVQGNGLTYSTPGTAESFSNGTLNDINQVGILLSGSSCATVTNTSISVTKDYGVIIGALGCDPDLSGMVLNSTGPRGNNHIRQHGFYFGGTRTIHNRGYAYDVETLPITAGGNLSLEPGVELFIDADAAAIVSSATLTALGTPTEPIRITSTSGDDQSRWNGLVLNDGSSAQLAYVTLENIRAGQAIALGGVIQAQLDHLIVRHVQGNGLSYGPHGTAETLSNSVLDDISGRGLTFADPGCAQVTLTKISHTGDYGVLIGSLGCDPDLTGLELAGTGPNGNNHIRQDAFYFGGTRTLHNRGYEYDLNGTTTTTTGNLTVEPGVVLHMPTDLALLIGTGSLTMQGTPGAPIRVTSMTGDASSRWGGIVLNDGSTSSLTNVIVEYVQAGQAVALGAVQQAQLDHLRVMHIIGSGLTFGPHGSAESVSNTVLEDLSGLGIRFAGPACAQVTNTTIHQTGDYGVVIGDLSCDPDLSGLALANTGPSGNNRIRQETFYFGGTRTLHNRGYEYDLNGTAAITTGSLAVEPGVVLHLPPDQGVSVGTGSLTAVGTSGAPIRITSLTGDASSAWNGVVLNDGAHVMMRGVQIDHAVGDAALTVGNLDASSKLEYLTVRDNAAVGVIVNSQRPQSLSPANILGNTTTRNAPAGLWNRGTGLVTATNVFWGDPTGPFHPISNPGGLGNAVSDNVIFDPWVGETVLLPVPLTVSVPPDVTVRAAAGAYRASVDVGTATATGPRGVVVAALRSDGAALANPYRAGVTDITWTATDPSGNTVAGVQHVTVLLDPRTQVLALDPTQGATIQLPLGHGQLVFPPNLVDVPTLVVLTEQAVPPEPLAAGQIFANRAYTLNVVNAATEAPIHQFRTSYTTSITYVDADLAQAGISSASTLSLASFNGSTWQPETGGLIDVANHTVVTSLTHASDWALVGTNLDVGCTACGGPPPEPGATPELDSLVLLAAGAAGLLGYARFPRRPRAFRQRRSVIRE
jgi:hypothetical protein